MQATNTNALKRSPYDMRQEEKQGTGMNLVEMVLWLLIMAALSLGMLWLMWTHSN